MKAVTIFSLTARAIWIENVFSSKFLAQKIMFLKPWNFFFFENFRTLPKSRLEVALVYQMKKRTLILKWLGQFEISQIGVFRTLSNGIVELILVKSFIIDAWQNRKYLLIHSLIQFLISIVWKMYFFCNIFRFVFGYWRTITVWW